MDVLLGLTVTNDESVLGLDDDVKNFYQLFVVLSIGQHAEGSCKFTSASLATSHKFSRKVFDEAKTKIFFLLRLEC